jgi:hypothetical protein
VIAFVKIVAFVIVFDTIVALVISFVTAVSFFIYLIAQRTPTTVMWRDDLWNVSVFQRVLPCNILFCSTSSTVDTRIVCSIVFNRFLQILS